MSIPPSASPLQYSTAAVILADILSTDLSIAEQNSLGNWFELLGQIILTNASQQQLINSRENNDKTKKDDFIG